MGKTKDKEGIVHCFVVFGKQIPGERKREREQGG